MKTKRFALMQLRSLILSICGLIILVGLVSIFISKTFPVASLATSTQQLTQIVTSTVNASPTNYPSVDIIGTKNAIYTQIYATRTAAAKTPWWYAATPWPPPTRGPSSTPNFSDVRHQVAGDGTIVWDFLQGVKNYPITVYNQWYDNYGGIRVFAGSIDPEQGVVAVLTPETKILNPEIYPTPRKSGMVEIIDAQGERLVLRSTTTGDIFYFDVPTRQFVDSLTATLVAPTVTPQPTPTPFPTIPYPPKMPLTPTPGAYPPPQNPTASAATDTPQP